MPVGCIAVGLSLTAFELLADNDGNRDREDCTPMAWYRSFTHLARGGRMTVTIGRRELLAALGGAAAAWPLAARAQQAGKLPTIGFLSADPSIESKRVAAFVQRLRELGWIDGRNLAIEYRWTEGRNERYAEIV